MYSDDTGRQQRITRSLILWINLSTEKLQGKTYHNMFTFFNHKATKWSLFGEWVIIAVVLCLVSVCRKMSARQSKQHDQPLSGLSASPLEPTLPSSAVINIVITRSQHTFEPSKYFWESGGFSAIKYYLLGGQLGCTLNLLLKCCSVFPQCYRTMLWEK